MCFQCKGDGKIPIYDYRLDVEAWKICDTCDGQGTIPDPDDFTTTLSDLVQAKEINYND